MKSLKTKFILAYLIASFIFYLICALFMQDLNISNWDYVIRDIFTLGVIFLLPIGSYYDYRRGCK